MNTWTIRYTEPDGQHVELDPMPENDAKTLLDGIRRHIDQDAALADLAEEAASKFPVGTRIRHTMRGWVGTVVADDPRHAPFPRIPATAPVTHVPTGQYTAVCVQFDHRNSPEWFDATFIEPVNGDD